MSKQTLKVPAEISGVKTMSDGGLRLSVDTQEIASSDKALVMDLHKKIGWFLFAESNIAKEELVDLPDIKLEKGQKSESQRLRAVLFLLWDKQGKKGNFDDFYKRYMNKLIEQLKEKLD